MIPPSTPQHLHFSANASNPVDSTWSREILGAAEIQLLLQVTGFSSLSHPSYVSHPSCASHLTHLTSSAQWRCLSCSIHSGQRAARARRFRLQRDTAVLMISSHRKASTEEQKLQMQRTIQRNFWRMATTCLHRITKGLYRPKETARIQWCGFTGIEWTSC